MGAIVKLAAARIRLGAACAGLVVVASLLGAVPAQAAEAPPGIPGAPAARAGVYSATVTVVPPVTGGTPAAYTVTSSGWPQSCTIQGSSGSCTVTGLYNAQACTFTATASNAAGTSAPSPASNQIYTPQSVFTDVATTDQFHGQVTQAADLRLMMGWFEADGTRTFRPGTSMRRDAMAAILYRLASHPVFTPPAQSPFTDVTLENPFYKEITWAASRNVALGWTEPDGTRTFRPSLPVQRDATAAFFYRLFYLPPVVTPAATISPFTDVTPETPFYNEILWFSTYPTAISTGWTEPDGTKTFRPTNAVTRDAMAAFVTRYLGIRE